MTFAPPPPQPPEHYAAAWRSLRLRSWLVLALFVLYLPAMIAAVTILNQISPGFGERNGFWLFVGWAALVGFAALYLATFACPNCGAWFGSDKGLAKAFSRECRYCGQQRYSAPPSRI